MKTTNLNIAKQVATEIIRQLGGNKFIAMTGSKNFAFGTDEKGNPFLSMHLTRNNAKAKYLNITLNSLDLYDMRFTKIDKNYNLITVAEENGVYNEMLQGVFTKITGLYTHL